MLLVLRSSTSCYASTSQPCFCCLCVGFLHYQQRYSQNVLCMMLVRYWNLLVMMPCIVITTESNSPNIHQSIETMDFGSNQTPISRELTSFYTKESDNDHVRDPFLWNGIGGSDVDVNHPPPFLPSWHHHPCDSFSFPPPPPPGMRRPGPRRKLFLRFNSFLL